MWLINWMITNTAYLTSYRSSPTYLPSQLRRRFTSHIKWGHFAMCNDVGRFPDRFCDEMAKHTHCRRCRLRKTYSSKWWFCMWIAQCIVPADPSKRFTQRSQGDFIAELFSGWKPCWFNPLGASSEANEKGDQGLLHGTHASFCLRVYSFVFFFELHFHSLLFSSFSIIPSSHTSCLSSFIFSLSIQFSSSLSWSTRYILPNARFHLLFSFIFSCSSSSYSSFPSPFQPLICLFVVFTHSSSSRFSFFVLLFRLLFSLSLPFLLKFLLFFLLERPSLLLLLFVLFSIILFLCSTYSWIV